MNRVPVKEFRILGDERGQLVALEGTRNVPFSISRVYYITNLKPNFPRGFHAHRKLQQMAVVVSGSCRFILDDGQNKSEIILDKSHCGLFIDQMIWHEMHDFSDDCVLMVLASEFYDEADYIRDYTQFLQAVSNV